MFALRMSGRIARVHSFGGQAVDDFDVQCLAVVVRDEDVRCDVADVVTVVDCVCGSVNERRRRDGREAAELAAARRRHVLPMLSAVARQLDEPVVGADPNLALAMSRRAFDVENRVALLGTRDVVRDRAAGGLLMFLDVAREIGADRRPDAVRDRSFGRRRCRRSSRSLSAVPWRERDRRLPIETILAGRGYRSSSTTSA